MTCAQSVASSEDYQSQGERRSLEVSGGVLSTLRHDTSTYDFDRSANHHLGVHHAPTPTSLASQVDPIGRATAQVEHSFTRHGHRTEDGPDKGPVFRDRYFFYGQMASRQGKMRVRALLFAKNRQAEYLQRSQHDRVEVASGYQGCHRFLGRDVRDRRVENFDHIATGRRMHQRSVDPTTARCQQGQEDKQKGSHHPRTS